jgi:hydroxyacylglutathione hydrolase
LDHLRSRLIRITCTLCLFLAASALAAAAEGLKPEDPKVQAMFAREELSPGVWRIMDPGSVNAYLVIGEDRALLIDSGTGAGDLGLYVKSITRLPVWLVNTHGHDDHAGANRRFDEIYAGRKDLAAVKRFSPGKRVAPMDEGYVFDLGGRKLSVIETPGHTPGSICLLDSASRILFTGDNNNTHVWLFLGDSLSVESYLRSLEALIARSKEFDVMYPGHGGPLEPGYLGDLAACARKILADEGPFPAYPGHYGAKACDYGQAKIAFDPRKVRDKAK